MTYHCQYCDEDVPNNRLILHSETKRHKLLCVREKSDGGAYVVSSAFKCRIITYRINAGADNFLNPEGFLSSNKKRIKRLVKLEVENHKQIKVIGELLCMYMKTVASEKSDEIIHDLKTFSTKNISLDAGFDFNFFFNQMVPSIVGKMEEFQERDSGWALEKIIFFDLNINKHCSLKASSYIPLPDWIVKKKACVNVKNNDEACFMWAVRAGIFPQDLNGGRMSKYTQFRDRLNWDGLSFPTKIKDIKRFERHNDVRVNVYGIDEKEERLIVPLYISRWNPSKETKTRHVNLLYHENRRGSHYSTIKSMSRLLSTNTGNSRKKHYCDGCLQYFASNEKFMLHVRIGCGEKAILLPYEHEKIIKFKNFNHKMKVPFTVYADFESILSPINRKDSETKYTFNVNEHIPCSFAYYLHCDYDETLSKFVTYRGKDCVQKFVENLYADGRKIDRIISRTHLPMDLNSPTEMDSEICHICEEPLVDDCVIDHCHLTGKVRGKAHNACNLNYTIPKFLPVIFHNLSGYDGHLFINELSKSDGKIDCIPHNKEKYILFHKELTSKFTLRFIDSYKFIASSLTNLVNNLSHDQYHILPKHITDCSNKDKALAIKLLSRKGVFPYEYVNSWERLEENAFPAKSDFYSQISDSQIDDVDYQHAQEVWEKFNIKTLGEYSDLYLKTDVLLLAEVFENFRKVCLDTYKLDPCHYYTTPGLSWSEMLKFTRVQLELLTDYEMIQVIKGGIRGDVSHVMKRQSVANNKFMKKYNHEEESTFITYLDVNNLYGWAMMQHLPISGFKWLTREEIDLFDIYIIQQDSSDGYILEVDLKYPNHLHDAHRDYPFCAETKSPPGSKTKKLLLSLEDRSNYIIHGVNLRQCVENGLVCVKIHRILTFHQKPWLKPYVDLNSVKRAQATSTFEKNLYKLFVNSIFGKSIENIKKRKIIHFCQHWEDIDTLTKPHYGLERFISKPNFHSCIIFSEELVAVQLNPTKVTYDKPTYAGFSILELSKTLMYDFHYNYMMPKYGDKSRLLYTNTDSFIYEIKTDNFFEDIKPDLESKYDTSDFPTDNIHGFPQVNKKIGGVMKDETQERIITEFIGLRSKMYAYTLDDDENSKVTCVKKSKGVTAAAVRKIQFDNYRKCLNLTSAFYDTVHTIASDKHKLYTQSKRKKTLCGLDDKRFINNDHVTTLPWGHYTLNNHKST